MFNLFNQDTVPTNTFQTFLNIGAENIGEGILSATIKLKAYIEGVLSNKIIPYDNNRGNGKLYMSKVIMIAENYDPNKLGVITISDWEDGTYVTADAHHRTASIIKKYKGEDGITPFTKAQLEQNVSLHIIKKEDFIRVYSGLNAGNGHSTKQKVLNEDLGLGSLIKDLLSLQEEDSVIKDTFYTTIARCVFGYIGEITKDVKSASYADISMNRKLISGDAGLSKEDFKHRVTAKQKEEIAAAMDYVNIVYAEFQRLNNLSTKKDVKPKLNHTGRSILRNASLYGLILWDKLSGRELITYLTPTNLALRITEKDAQIDKQAKFILNSELRDAAAEKIVLYITTKKRI